MEHANCKAERFKAKPGFCWGVTEQSGGPQRAKNKSCFSVHPRRQDWSAPSSSSTLYSSVVSQRWKAHSLWIMCTPASWCLVFFIFLVFLLSLLEEYTMENIHLLLLANMHVWPWRDIYKSSKAYSQKTLYIQLFKLRFCAAIGTWKISTTPCVVVSLLIPLWY